MPIRNSSVAGDIESPIRQQLAASDLGFALGPRLNAAGRPDELCPFGVALFVRTTSAKARVLASELDALNQTRKEIEQGMQAEALILCESKSAVKRFRAVWRCIILNGTPRAWSKVWPVAH